LKKPERQRRDTCVYRRSRQQVEGPEIQTVKVSLAKGLKRQGFYTLPAKSRVRTREKIWKGREKRSIKGTPPSKSEPGKVSQDESHAKRSPLRKGDAAL